MFSGCNFPLSPVYLIYIHVDLFSKHVLPANNKEQRVVHLMNPMFVYYNIIVNINGQCQWGNNTEGSGALEGC